MTLLKLLSCRSVQALWSFLLIAALLTAAGSAIAQSSSDWLQADQNVLEEAAQSGIAEAQYTLGVRYHEGQHVLQNFAQAALWFRQAAEQGHAGAQNRLGQYLFGGLGLAQDNAAALRWLEDAAASGNPQYIYDLAVAVGNHTDGRDPDPKRAAQLFRQAAEKGHDDAMVSLGVLYQNGHGVEKNLTKARELYEGPASRGNARAMNNLGLLYVRGESVPQDYTYAAKLFSAAVEQGLPVAMTNLGVLYENGFGVPVNEEYAAELYRRGGRGGGEVSGQQIGLVYDPRLALPDSSPEGMRLLQQGVDAGDPVALFQMAWLQLSNQEATIQEKIFASGLMISAAESGMAYAKMNLGILYFEGLGLPQDYALGRMWLILAASGGLQEAINLSATLSVRMTPDQINEAQEMAAKYIR